MIIKTNSKGYNYKYTDLAGINQTLEELGISYEQETRTEQNGEDYIYTRLIDKDGKIGEWRRGAKIVQATLSGKSNPAQEYGSALTYARRYSLYMICGVATEDDDAQSLNGAKKTPVFQNYKDTNPITDIQKNNIEILYAQLNLTDEEKNKGVAYFGKLSLDDLNEEQGKRYIDLLEKKKVEKAVIENAKANPKHKAEVK